MLKVRGSLYAKGSFSLKQNLKIIGGSTTAIHTKYLVNEVKDYKLETHTQTQ